MICINFCALSPPRPKADGGEWKPGYMPFTQNLIFNYPMQAPDEIARTARIEATRGLAGGR